VVRADTNTTLSFSIVRQLRIFGRLNAVVGAWAHGKPVAARETDRRRFSGGHAKGVIEPGRSGPPHVGPGVTTAGN